MRLIPYLNFDGQCREAFDFYAKALGGQLIGPPMTYGESPMAAQCAAGTENRIMHAQIDANGATLMGSDTPPGMAQPGSATLVNVDVKTVEEAERIFAALAKGGQVQMPMAETFWARRWGMLIDRYGKPWMVNCMTPAG